MTVQDILFTFQDTPKDYEVLIYDIDGNLCTLATTYTFDTPGKRICLEVHHVQ